MILGARTGAWAKSGGVVPTACDYVQDGLVAMWDGIENAGWGVHDGNSNTWIDLIGGLKFTFTGTIEFGDDNLLIPTTSSRANCSIASIPTINSVEMVAKITSIKNFTCFISLAKNSSYCVLGTRYNDTRLSYQSCAVPNVSSLNKRRSYSGTLGNTTQFYSNNVLVRGSIAGWSSSYWKDDIVWINMESSWITTGEVNSIRLYSRDLTEEEIANNYAVDKARFNLT